MIGNLYSNTNLSQQDKILLHLINNNKISSKECEKLYGFKHLASVIRYLRKRNINIKSETEAWGSGMKVNTCSVNYILAPMKEQPIQVVKMIDNLKHVYKVA